MAISPAHRFGQIIGEVLELATLPLLTRFAEQHGLYLDKHGPRPCRRGLKCSWRDLNGNTHDLDYVMERGGAPDVIGAPAAFIETAWRRYTKHSRNKAQEIQGAVGPLAQTYGSSGPFMGAILAGEFTAGALAQLKSLGFTVLYFPYISVVKVFTDHGIDAAFDEQTPDAEFALKVAACDAIGQEAREALAGDLLTAHQQDVDAFIGSLTAAVQRKIDRIVVLPLHGTSQELPTIDDAVRFIQEYNDTQCSVAADRYEILIRYNNGDRIEGTFKDKNTAIRYLQTFRPPVA